MNIISFCNISYFVCPIEVVLKLSAVYILSIICLPSSKNPTYKIKYFQETIEPVKNALILHDRQLCIIKLPPSECRGFLGINKIHMLTNHDPPHYTLFIHLELLT